MQVLPEKSGLICVISPSYFLIILRRIYFDVFISNIIVSLKFKLLCYVISKVDTLRKKAHAVWNL